MQKKDYNNAYNELPTTREFVIEVVGGMLSLVMLAGFPFRSSFNWRCTIMEFTSLQGHVTATFQELVEAFGAPTYSEPSGDGKVNTEWELILGTDAGARHHL